MFAFHLIPKGEYFMAGARCRGRYCDSKHFFICHLDYKQVGVYTFGGRPANAPTWPLTRPPTMFPTKHPIWETLTPVPISAPTLTPLSAPPPPVTSASPRLVSDNYAFYYINSIMKSSLRFFLQHNFAIAGPRYLNASWQRRSSTLIDSKCHCACFVASSP